jgi:hypothetical protein
MSRVVILGAGITGHTAAAFARKWLGPEDTVTVVSPNETYNWIPSNIWVGVGLISTLLTGCTRGLRTASAPGRTAGSAGSPRMISR